MFVDSDLCKLLGHYSSQAFVSRQAVGELKVVRFCFASSYLGIPMCRVPICAMPLEDYNSEAIVVHHAISVVGSFFVLFFLSSSS